MEGGGPESFLFRSVMLAVSRVPLNISREQFPWCSWEQHVQVCVCVCVCACVHIVCECSSHIFHQRSHCPFHPQSWSLELGIKSAALWA